jgi:nickel-type superoxide dismutase maturation protease
MKPCLRSGQEVLVNLKAYQQVSPKVGDIVYLRHPLRADTLMFKRVGAIQFDERFTVVGDNPSESSDSRQFGCVRKEHIKGQVVCLFP